MEEKNQTPKQFPVSKAMAEAIEANVKALAPLQEQFLAAKKALTAAMASHTNFFDALVKDAGFKPEEFANWAIWGGEGEDAGKVFIRAK